MPTSSVTALAAAIPSVSEVIVVLLLPMPLLFSLLPSPAPTAAPTAALGLSCLLSVTVMN